MRDPEACPGSTRPRAGEESGPGALRFPAVREATTPARRALLRPANLPCRRGEGTPAAPAAYPTSPLPLRAYLVCTQAGPLPEAAPQPAHPAAAGRSQSRAVIRTICAREQPQEPRPPSAQIRRYTGDRRSPKPFGRITLDTRVIIANFFEAICGDDHPCITRSGTQRPHAPAHAV